MTLKLSGMHLWADVVQTAAHNHQQCFLNVVHWPGTDYSTTPATILQASSHINICV
jgi:hypothetical protein